MVEIEVHYEGELHTVARHGPSGAALESDAPTDNQGRGESYSPTDLVATGLATCMLTVMGIRACKEGWAMEGARARVEKHMTTEPVRRISRLVLDISMPPTLPEDSHPVLEQIARTCPVAQSIHPEIEVDLSFVWTGA